MQIKIQMKSNHTELKPIRPPFYSNFVRHAIFFLPASQTPLRALYNSMTKHL
jgi:hypothetical protein